MSMDKVVSMQVIEGGTDAIIFEHFIYKTLDAIRRDPATRTKRVVLLMDNATIHKSPIIYTTARKMKATILLNA